MTYSSYSDYYRREYSDTHQKHILAGRNGARLFLVEGRPAGVYNEPAMNSITLQLCVGGHAEVGIDLGAGVFRGRARPGHWIVAPPAQRCLYELTDSIDLQMLELPTTVFDEFEKEASFDLGPLQHQLSDDRAVFHLARGLWHEICLPNTLGSMWADQAIATITGMLWRAKQPRQSRPIRGGLAAWQLKRACEAMMAALDSDPGLDDLAAVVGCSPTHFSRAFKQSTGVAPFHWLLSRRIEHAKTLLEENRLSIVEIALAVGFSAQPQFTTAFGRVTGMTPGQWRRERLR